MWNENRSSRSCVVLLTSQRDVHRALVDEYDFIFVEVLVRRNSVPGGISSVPTMSVSDPAVTGSTLKMSDFFPSNIQRSPSSA
jgi:hypothetical protein